MDKDILGKREFDSLKIQCETIDNGRCLATGTCYHQPIHPTTYHFATSKLISFLPDAKNAQDIKEKYGYLRS